MTCRPPPRRPDTRGKLAKIPLAQIKPHSTKEIRRPRSLPPWQRSLRVGKDRRRLDPTPGGRVAFDRERGSSRGTLQHIQRDRIIRSVVIRLDKRFGRGLHRQLGGVSGGRSARSEAEDHRDDRNALGMRAISVVISRSSGGRKRAGEKRATGSRVMLPVRVNGSSK